MVAFKPQVIKLSQYCRCLIKTVKEKGRGCCKCAPGIEIEIERDLETVVVGAGVRFVGVGVRFVGVVVRVVEISRGAIWQRKREEEKEKEKVLMFTHRYQV
jgi:hypothetical protein